MKIPAFATHRPCLILSLLLALGMTMGFYLSSWVWVYLSIAIILIIFRRWSLAVLCVGALLMSVHRIIPPQPQGEIIGIVDTDVMTNAKGIRPAQVFIFKYLNGHAPAKYFGKEQLKYGDQIKINSKWYRQGSHWQDYLDHKQYYWQVSIGANQLTRLQSNQGHTLIALSIALKNKMKAIVNQYLSAASAPTVIAMLTGERAAMSPQLKDLFIRSGTAHILAISGMNMGIIAAMFMFLLRCAHMPRRGQFAITILLLWFYTFLSGASPPVVRACLMATVILLALMLDEGAEPLNSLGLSALILLIINPGNLLDIGFQLSFMAVAGIFLGYDYIVKRLEFLPGWLAKSLAVSIAASLATAPITFIHFQTIVPIGIIANIIIVPLADLIVLLGLCLVLVVITVPILAPSLGACLDGIFHAMMWSAYWFAQVPFGAIIY